MNLNGKKVGIALTGSFCTYEKMFIELQKLVSAGADVYPIMSDASTSIKSRFGKPDTYVTKLLKEKVSLCLVIVNIVNTTNAKNTNVQIAFFFPLFIL